MERAQSTQQPTFIIDMSCFLLADETLWTPTKSVMFYYWSQFHLFVATAQQSQWNESDCWTGPVCSQHFFWYDASKKVICSFSYFAVIFYCFTGAGIIKHCVYYATRNSCTVNANKITSSVLLSYSKQKWQFFNSFSENYLVAINYYSSIPTCGSRVKHNTSDGWVSCVIYSVLATRRFWLVWSYKSWSHLLDQVGTVPNTPGYMVPVCGTVASWVLLYSAQNYPVGKQRTLPEFVLTRCIMGDSTSLYPYVVRISISRSVGRCSTPNLYRCTWRK